MDSPFAVGIAFWIFVAVAVVAGVWKEYASKRETERTIRAAIEKGQQLDPALVERMLRPKKGDETQELIIGGTVLIAIGFGLADHGILHRHCQRGDGTGVHPDGRRDSRRDDRRGASYRSAFREAWRRGFQAVVG